MSTETKAWSENFWRKFLYGYYCLVVNPWITSLHKNHRNEATVILLSFVSNWLRKMISKMMLTVWLKDGLRAPFTEIELEAYPELISIESSVLGTSATEVRFTFQRFHWKFSRHFWIILYSNECRCITPYFKSKKFPSIASFN